MEIVEFNINLKNILWKVFKNHWKSLSGDVCSETNLSMLSENIDFTNIEYTFFFRLCNKKNIKKDYFNKNHVHCAFIAEKHNVHDLVEIFEDDKLFLKKNRGNLNFIDLNIIDFTPPKTNSLINKLDKYMLHIAIDEEQFPIKSAQVITELNILKQTTRFLCYKLYSLGAISNQNFEIAKQDRRFQISCKFYPCR